MSDCLIIIPAHNEEKNIGRVLSELKKQYPRMDILVVDDGSVDSTAAVVEREQVLLISLPYNLGYGGALQTGYKYAVNAGYCCVIQFDADGQHDPCDIGTILELLEEKKWDIVLGSRFLGKSSYRVGFVKMFAIRTFRLLIKLTTGVRITDPSSGLQGLSYRTFTYYAGLGRYPSDYPDADVLIQMLLSGYSICEFPANIRDRDSGKSMHNGIKPLYYGLKMLVSICVVLLRKKSGGGVNNE